MKREGRGANRLIHEMSPYLQQHADNPVDWFPWGDEALKRARSEDRPILLSIGYSTCHWCHVMESESFASPEIAEIMNRHFVCIKVDREERPDLDQIYMNAVTALTGSGGWPLNVFLTPEGDPFFGGTYFPPRSRQSGMPSWPDVLQQVAAAWTNPEQRSQLRAGGGKMTRYLAKRLAGTGDRTEPETDLVHQAVDRLAPNFDDRWAGFGQAPKFPSPPTLAFLLDYSTHAGLGPTAGDRQKKAREMALRTLEHMAGGGIFDHLGGGFHRYATDPQWRVPHFEKMLYDNAQLIGVYCRAHELTGEALYAATAAMTADYVLRDMTHEAGGFYSAEDADSMPPGSTDAAPRPKREGAFFLWTQKEIMDLLGPEMGDVFCRRYGVARDGNVTFDPHGEFMGQNILYAAATPETISQLCGRPPDAVSEMLATARSRLLDERERRPRPHRDDKILSAWNGLMISALARCHQVLDDRRHLDAAEKAADFLLDRLYEPEARTLYRRWRNGDRKVPGTSEDYFFVIQGLLDLYETGFDPERLNTAIALIDEAIDHFHDPDGGGFFMTRADHDPHLIVRTKEEMDMVLPSANAVAARSLLRAARLTGRSDLVERGAATLRAGLAKFSAHPEAVTAMLSARLFQEAVPVQVVVAGSLEAPETRDLIRAARDPMVQGKTLMHVRDDADRRTLGARLPFVRSAVEVSGRPAAYACIGRSCKAPVVDPGALAGLLSPVRFRATGSPTG